MGRCCHRYLNTIMYFRESYRCNDSDSGYIMLLKINELSFRWFYLSLFSSNWISCIDSTNIYWIIINCRLLFFIINIRQVIIYTRIFYTWWLYQSSFSHVFSVLVAVYESNVPSRSALANYTQNRKHTILFESNFHPTVSAVIGLFYVRISNKVISVL